MSLPSKYEGKNWNWLKLFNHAANVISPDNQLLGPQSSNWARCFWCRSALCYKKSSDCVLSNAVAVHSPFSQVLVRFCQLQQCNWMCRTFFQTWASVSQSQSVAVNIKADSLQRALWSTSTAKNGKVFEKIIFKHPAWFPFNNHTWRPIEGMFICSEFHLFVADHIRLFLWSVHPFHQLVSDINCLDLLFVFIWYLLSLLFS